MWSSWTSRRPGWTPRPAATCGMSWSPSGSAAKLVEGLAAPTRVLLKQGVSPVELARGINGVESAAEENDLLTMTTRAPGPVLAYLADNVSLDTLQVRTTTLEDVFLNLTGRE